MSNDPNGQWQQGMMPGMDSNAYGQGMNQQALMAMMMGQQQPPMGQNDIDGMQQQQDGSGEAMPQQQQSMMMSPGGQMQGFVAPGMQGMAGFFPGMGMAPGFMDPNAMMQMQQMNAMNMNAMGMGMGMGMHPGALGAGEAAENSAAALTQMNQQNMMNQNAFFQMLQQQAAFQNPFMAGMGANGQQFAGLSGAAGLTAASYLNMAQQAGIGSGAMGVAADLQQSMIPGMMGAAGRDPGAVLNPFARQDKKVKQKKPKNKPKRPLSAYNIFFKDEREKILKGIPAGGKKATSVDDGGDSTKKEGEEAKKEGDKAKKEDGDNVKTEDGDQVKNDDGGDSAIKEEDDGAKKEEKAGAEVKIEGEEGADDKPDGDEEDKKESGDGEEGGKGGKKRKRVPHGKIGFESLAKIIGRRWKELPPEQLDVYKKRADEDMQRYRKEMEVYLQKQREGLEASRELIQDGNPGDSAKMPANADDGDADEE